MSNQKAIEKYWVAFNEGDLDGICDALHPHVVIRYPQSGEVFRGRETYRDVLRHYPGGLPTGEAASLDSDPQTVVVPSPRPFGPPIVTVTGGDELFVGQATFTYPDGSVYHSVSIYRVVDGLIRSEIAYFAEPFEAPEWRGQWAEQG